MQAASNRGNGMSMEKAFVQQWTFYGWYDVDDDTFQMIPLASNQYHVQVVTLNDREENAWIELLKYLITFAYLLTE